jgi:hypothetical protein
LVVSYGELVPAKYECALENRLFFESALAAAPEQELTDRLEY